MSPSSPSKSGSTQPSPGAKPPKPPSGKPTSKGGAPVPPKPLMLAVVLLMEATTTPLAKEVTPAWLEAAAGSITQQLNVDVSAYYGGTYSVRVGSSPTDIREGEIAFTTVDSLPADPDAVAYHDVTGKAVPVAFLALSMCSTLDDVSSAISHELCEIAGDAPCNVWVDAGSGREYAKELCDAVQANSYTIDAVVVSDFLLPAFFATGAPGPYCFTQAMGVGDNYPSAPFATTKGGYQIVRDVGGNETEVDGTKKPRLAMIEGELGPRTAKSQHWSSRTWRRMHEAA